MAISRFCFFFLFCTALATTSCTRHAPTAHSADSEPLRLYAADGSSLVLDRIWHEKKATLIVFWSSQCPCVRRYQARVDALLNQFPSVRVLAVSSNAGETLEEDLSVAKERGAKVALWRDKNGAVARALGAHSTPTVVLVDARGTIRYRGWIDNERLPGESGREPWLENAIRGVLANHNDFASRSPVYGCAITRSLFSDNQPPCCKKSSQESRP
jgi:thioredoxin-related protein